MNGDPGDDGARHEARPALGRQISRQVGRIFPSHVSHVTTAAIAAFARAIGDTDPIFADPVAARAAGHAAMPAPPTFLFPLSIAKPRPYDVYDDLGIPQARILHAEQWFSFRTPVRAGQVLTFTPRLSHAGEKRGGTLLFATVTTTVEDAEGRAVAELGTVIAIRQDREGVTPADAADGPATLRPDTAGPDTIRPVITMPAISQTTLAAYATASGDHNPIHLDAAAARRAGLDDVIAHGMLIAAYAGRAIGQWFPQRPIARFATRFTRMTRLGDAISLSIVASDPGPRQAGQEAGGDIGRERTYVVSAHNQSGGLKLRAEVVFAD